MIKKLGINCFILNGGKSTRMGKDKTSLSINGMSFLDQIIQEIAPIFEKCYLVGKKHYHSLSAGWFEDIIKDIGPMGGLYTALFNSDTDINFIIASDYPLVKRGVVYSFIQHSEIYLEKQDGIIPLYEDGPHPLFGIYRKSCLKCIDKCIKTKQFSLLNISDYCNIMFVEIKNLIPENMKIHLKRSLINVNTPDDYEKLNSIIKNSPNKKNYQ